MKDLIVVGIKLVKNISSEIFENHRNWAENRYALFWHTREVRNFVWIAIKVVACLSLLENDVVSHCAGFFLSAAALQIRICYCLRRLPKHFYFRIECFKKHRRIIIISPKKNIFDAILIARTMTASVARPSDCEGSVTFRTSRDNVWYTKIFCIQLFCLL